MSGSTAIGLAIFFLSSSVVGAILATRRSAAETASTGRTELVACRDRHVVRNGESLDAVSTEHFDETGYRWAILTATNLKSGTGPYKYVDSRFDLKKGASLCIPDKESADALRRRYDAYLKAGQAAMLSEPPVETRPLVRLDQKQRTFVTWTRRQRADEIDSMKKVAAETWVTVAPHLQTFCRTYVRTHAPESDELTLRLEQRLGLPPGSGYTTFVELEIDPNSKEAWLFRPCGDRSTDTIRCPPVALPEPTKFVEELAKWTMPGNGAERGRIESWYWYLHRYHQSYAVPSPHQYPWTGAGYTFDWANEPDDDQRFVRWGESEFVVGAGAPLSKVEIRETADFCAPG